VIAADLGGHHASAWGWPVHLLIGDLDSLDPGEVQALRDAGVPVITAPVAKDETDLELALARALEEGLEQIVICAALGGRVDHLLANVLLLARPDLEGRDVLIADGQQTVRLLRNCDPDRPAALALSGRAGDLLSLLPVSDAAVGVTTEGLLYPLNDETLYLGQGRGVSNEFLGGEARVRLRSGMLVVVHTQGQPGVMMSADGLQPSAA
jgi:thiamine pyrophosphokinase